MTNVTSKRILMCGVAECDETEYLACCLPGQGVRADMRQTVVKPNAQDTEQVLLLEHKCQLVSMTAK